MPASRQFSVPVGHTGLPLESRVTDLRLILDLVPPTLLAGRTGTHYLELGQGRGEFHFQFLGESILLTYPDFRAVKTNGEHLPVIKQALLMYYFSTCDGVLPSGHWVSFANLPDGRVYSSAFKGYTGDAIAKGFGLDIHGFCVACESLNANRIEMGDAAYIFLPLPNLPIAAIYHQGDEDFPSTCNLLFDANVPHSLPTEACAILGSMLTQKILQTKSLSA